MTAQGMLPLDLGEPPPSATGALPPRPYQAEAITAVLAAPGRGITRPMFVLPCGSGKTVIFSHVIGQRPGRSLVIAHRDELIEQAAGKLRQVCGSGLDIGIVKARRDEHDASCVVASVQTLARPGRAERLGRFGTVVADECHHSVSDTWIDVLGRLGCMDDGGPLTVGCTATAGRTDKVGLGHVWQEIVYQRGIIQMIAEGYLVDVRGQQIGSDFNMANLRTRQGDYTDGSIEAELDRSDALRDAVRSWLEYAPGRPTAAFTPTIATAHALAAEFRRAGVTAEAVDGTMHIDERRAVLARLRSGETLVVPNAQVLCLDDQTEILTDTGWAGIDEMTPAHRVANWDQGRVYFAEPSEVVRRPREAHENMYVLETARRSIRVTGGHRMLYRTTDAGPYLKSPVDDLAGRCVALPTAGLADPADVAPEQVDLPGPERRKRIVSGQAYNLRTREGYGWDESFTEAERRVARRYGLERKHPAKLTEAECALIGFWLGDGSVNRLRRSGVEYTMSQATVYPAIVAWVDKILADTGLHVIRRDKSQGKVPHIKWSLPRGTGGGSQQREGVFPLEPYLDKAGSPLLWGLDKAQFDALVTGLWYADGNHGKASDGPPRSLHISGNGDLLNLLQAIASVRGWTATVSDKPRRVKPGHRQVWTLVLTPRTEHKMGGTDPSWRIQRETALWRPERVWCVKTETRNIITRRRGSVTVMGNTEGFDEPRISCTLLLRPTKSKPFFQQMCGRALRPFLGKDDALVLDVTGTAEDLGLATIADLAGLKPGSVPDGGSLLDAAEESERGERHAHAVAAARTKQIELLKRSELHWIPVDGAWLLPCAKNQEMLLVPADGDSWLVYRKETGKMPKLETERPLELDWARGVGEEVARAHDGVFSRSDQAWRTRPASAAQKARLERIGIRARKATQGEASDLIAAEDAARVIRWLGSR